MLYGSMCGGDVNWEEANFGDAPSTFPNKVYHVTIAGDNAEALQGKCGIPTGLGAPYGDADFENVMGDTLKSYEHFADIQQTGPTNLHDEITIVVEHDKDHGCLQAKVEQRQYYHLPEDDVPNNENSTVRHHSFMENMFQRRKQPLAKRKVKINKRT